MRFTLLDLTPETLEAMEDWIRHSDTMCGRSLGILSCTEWRAWSAEALKWLWLEKIRWLRSFGGQVDVVFEFPSLDYSIPVEATDVIELARDISLSTSYRGTAPELLAEALLVQILQEKVKITQIVDKVGWVGLKSWLSGEAEYAGIEDRECSQLPEDW